MTIKFVAVLFVVLVIAPSAGSDLLDYGKDEEDLHDTHINQILVPKTHQEDATHILNNLLKAYDKTLRPDIGGKRNLIWIFEQRLKMTQVPGIVMRLELSMVLKCHMPAAVLNAEGSCIWRCQWFQVLGVPVFLELSEVLKAHVSGPVCGSVV
ncbi:unnamed protein product [Ophioblennius macclurei]